MSRGSEKKIDVIGYHERTKHHPHRYARSPGYLDWTNEPDPFRRYEGAPLLELPFLERDPDTGYSGLYERGMNTFHTFTLRNIAAFLELSLGLSAWKSYGGTSWALRMNPSSGNLHPTEAHLILPPLTGDRDRGGIYHYNPFYHALEQRSTFDEEFWRVIKGHFGSDGFFVGLSSIYWREAWKYGERAFRYCNHDVGHAVACLGFSGNLLGWKSNYLNALSDEDLEIMLGFKGTKWKKFERENPELLMFLCKNSGQDVPRNIPDRIIRSFESLSFFGEPNLLSRNHVDWSVIDEVSAVTVKPKTPEKRYHYTDREYFEKEIRIKAADVIRRRRSALAYDGASSVPKEYFLGMLDRTIPRNKRAPFDLGAGEISVHLLIFVHRVSGLNPGLYFLIRNEKDFLEIREKCRSHFLWERVEDGPENLPLYLLEKGDYCSEAAAVSCGQDIAGDGVFSLAMIAKFSENVGRERFLYRYLHWETGMIGQVLYLEAEAYEMSGTGMGCFFDDPVHNILGFSDNSFQDLYHFAVGRAVEDKKLSTLPPYHHLTSSFRSKMPSR